MKRNYDGCKYSTYGELECPACVPKTHGPSVDSLDLVERFTSCGKGDWATQCQKNNAELDRLSNAFQDTATQWQKVTISAQVTPLVLYDVQGRIIQ